MVIDRGIVTMEDEYKVECALSNSAAFDDLEWLRTPVSRSQYSLKANISQTVHPIHSMFASRLWVFGIGGSNGAICGSIKSKMAADRHLGYTKMAITSQPVCWSTWCLANWDRRGIFGVGRSNGATFVDPEWPQTPVSRSQYSSKANISQTVHAAAKYIKCLMR